MTREQLTPDASHPITITPTRGRVTITRDGRTLAQTDAALTLEEAAYPPVHYVPIDDVTPGVLERTTHETYCPYKGEAAYFSLVDGEARVEDAVWTYEEPYDAVAPIRGHVAFYPDAVETTVAAG